MAHQPTNHRTSHPYSSLLDQHGIPKYRCSQFDSRSTPTYSGPLLTRMMALAPCPESGLIPQTSAMSRNAMTSSKSSRHGGT